MLPRWLKVTGVAFMVAVLGAVAFAVFEPLQVLPRIRLAPGYALVTADGSALTSEDGRGVITLYSFAPSDCGERCQETFNTLAEVRDRVPAEVDLGETGLRIVTIALDPSDDPTTLADALTRAEQRSGADGVDWQWAGGGEEAVRTVVGDGFRHWYHQGPDGTIEFDGGFALVDGNGLIRGEYRYQTLADDADKLVHHTAILADEVRNAHGAGALAYEAAHLFLCYP